MIKKSKQTPAREMLPVKLPKRCFVSHSYKDKAAIKSLKNNIPPGIELVIFPRKEPDTKKPVSNNIIPTILSCDGLIYLKGGHSESSQWVVFERDYGLRAEKAVFSYNPKTSTFAPDHGKSVKLQVQVFSSEYSKRRANKLIKWMHEERKFKISKAKTVYRMKEVPLLLAEMANAKKLIVWLVDDYTDGYVQFENEYGSDPDLFESLEIDDGWWPPPRIFAKIDPDWTPETYSDAEDYIVAREFGYVLPDVLDLFEGTKAKDFNWNRIDDLIVSITLKLSEPESVAVHEDW